MTNSEQPIYPVPYQNDDRSIQHDVYTGLTKREYFAGLALQGMLANIVATYGQPPNIKDDSIISEIKRRNEFINEVALVAVRYSDSLLEQLK